MTESCELAQSVKLGIQEQNMKYNNDDDDDHCDGRRRFVAFVDNLDLMSNRFCILSEEIARDMGWIYLRPDSILRYDLLQDEKGEVILELTNFAYFLFLFGLTIDMKNLTDK